jgi:hypothetical protein
MVAPEAALAADPVQQAEERAEAETPAKPLPEPQEPSKAERIAALIRNGLSNTAISQDERAWLALNTRLPEIVAAILQEA